MKSVNSDTINGIPDGKIVHCYQHACCLSDEWKGKVVIGYEIDHLEDIYSYPQGISWPIIQND